MPSLESASPFPLTSDEPHSVVCVKCKHVFFPSGTPSEAQTYLSSLRNTAIHHLLVECPKDGWLSAADLSAAPISWNQ